MLFFSKSLVSRALACRIGRSAARSAARRETPAPRTRRRHPFPHEIEVADLAAEGLSNRAIARRLYVSRTTVASHVGHIVVKLGFSSRAQIAAWAAQRRTPAP